MLIPQNKVHAIGISFHREHLACRFKPLYRRPHLPQGVPFAAAVQHLEHQGHGGQIWVISGTEQFAILFRINMNNKRQMTMRMSMTPMPASPPQRKFSQFEAFSPFSTLRQTHSSPSSQRGLVVGVGRVVKSESIAVNFEMQLYHQKMQLYHQKM